VTDQDGRLELDCAHAGIEQPLRVGKEGTFLATGYYVQEHGGPIQGGEGEDRQPASFLGQTDGTQMDLIIKLRDTGARSAASRFEKAKSRGFKCY